MGRLTGLEADITVNGLTVTYSLGWSMNTDAVILSHRGASEELDALYPIRSPRSGQFGCEADPDDAVQAALMIGVQSVGLVLKEDNGTTHSMTAVVWPSVAIPRDGKPVRTFAFRESG